LLSFVERCAELRSARARRLSRVVSAAVGVHAAGRAALAAPAPAAGARVDRVAHRSSDSDEPHAGAQLLARVAAANVRQRGVLDDDRRGRRVELRRAVDAARRSVSDAMIGARRGAAVAARRERVRGVVVRRAVDAAERARRVLVRVDGRAPGSVFG